MSAWRVLPLLSAWKSDTDDISEALEIAYKCPHISPATKDSVMTDM